MKKISNLIRLMAMIAIFIFNYAVFIQAQSKNSKSYEKPSNGESSKNLKQNKPDLQADKEDMTKAKAAITEILNDNIEIYDKVNQLTEIPKEITVLDDRIEFRFNIRMLCFISQTCRETVYLTRIMIKRELFWN